VSTLARPAVAGPPGGGVADAPAWARSLGAELQGRLLDATAVVGTLPVLDGTVQTMLALLDDPDSSSSAAVAVIEQDAEFAAQLLRLANSAYYGRRASWRTVRHAFAAIGRAAARRLCLECATYRFLQRAPGNGSASRGEMHVHALMVATLAAEVARQTAVPVETAHLTGLLHDFGKLVMPLVFGEEPLDEVANAYPAGGVGRARAEWERFGIDHAHAGALYAQSCGADGDLCAAIAYHHGGRSGVRVPSALAACVQVAEALAGVLGGAAPDWALTDEALGVLALDRAALDEIARSGVTGHAPVPDVPSALSAQLTELERLASTDELTGVLSRRSWIEHARQQLHTHRAGTLLLFDVDDFRQVNDTFGHPAGDALLTQLADILSQHGTVGRLGGDEFALWLHDPPRPAVQIADTILAQTATAFGWTRDADQPAITGISIGTASAPADADDLATLLELADATLYDAKRTGGYQARANHPHAPIHTSQDLRMDARI
jgi:diguanylate cyclase (GGDEF)-like protein/putative nucleotidyltransferase with HDIG domain